MNLDAEQLSHILAFGGYLQLLDRDPDRVRSLRRLTKLITCFNCRVHLSDECDRAAEHITGGFSESDVRAASEALGATVAEAAAGLKHVEAAHVPGASGRPWKAPTAQDRDSAP